MQEVFDPYRKWLGIAPHEQPPHYYRLLGIAPFEADTDVIQHAADRQMAHVRTFQGGKHGVWSQRILNELSAAKITLMDGARKLAYDAQLRAQLGVGGAIGGSPASPEGGPLMMATPLPAPPVPGGYMPAALPLGPGALPPGPLGMPPPAGAALPLGPPLAPLPLGQAVLRPVTVPAEPAGPVIGSGRNSGRVRTRRPNSSLTLTISAVAIGALALCGIAIAVSQLGDDSGTPAKHTAAHESKRPAETPDTTPKHDKSKAGEREKPERDKSSKTENAKPERTKPGKSKAEDEAAAPAEAEKPAPMRPRPTPTAAQREKLPRDERFRLALGDVRRHLAERRVEEARKALSIADDLSSGEVELNQVSQMQKLCDYIEQFWQAVRTGIFERIEEGQVLTHRGEELEFIARQGEDVTYRWSNQERKHAVAELPTAVAAAFARSGLNMKEPQSLVCLATFWAFDGQPDPKPKDMRRDKAKELWVEAAQQGAKDAALAAELALDEKFISEIKPKGEGDPPAKDNSFSKPELKNNPQPAPESKPAEKPAETSAAKPAES